MLPSSACLCSVDVHQGHDSYDIYSCIDISGYNGVKYLCSFCFLPLSNAFMDIPKQLLGI